MKALPVLFVLLAAPVFAETSLKIPITVYALSAAADKATTINCTARPGCSESMPGYAWLDRHGGIPAQMAVSTAVDILSIWAWQKYVGKRSPKLAKIGLYLGSGIRFSQAFVNLRRVQRSY